MLRTSLIAGALALGALLALPAGAASRAQGPLPQGVTLHKDIVLPADLAVAGYLPANKRKQRFFVSLGGYWAQPGKALSDAVTTALTGFFTGGFLAEVTDERPYNLLVVMHPDLKPEAGKVTTTINYRVFDGSGAMLLEGSQSSEAPIGDLSSGAGIYRASLRTAQLVMVDVVLKLRPDRSKHATTAMLKTFDRNLLVDRKNAVATGTGFFINATGDLLTAAHVTHDCVAVDAKRDDTTLPARVVASSNLLDLAVLATDKPVQRFLPLRKGHEIILGEAVTNVGFPLQKLLAASPNLTRGNVSSRGALDGSVGQFQFSAPIQPGSSGGPVVSDGGELLGITQGTLNLAPLVQSGALPQNVNFALDSHYAAMFMKKHGVQFAEVEPNLKADMRVGNEAALATVVSLSCYQ